MRLRRRSQTGHALPPSLKPLARGPGREQRETSPACRAGRARTSRSARRRRTGPGGNVIGTRSTVLQMRCSPRIVQNGFDLPQQPQLGPAQRNAVAPRLQEPRRPCRCASTTAAADTCADRDRENRRCCARRMHAGAERRPRDRRDRRKRRPQPLVAAHRREFREVRQQAFPHELVGQVRILSVEPDDDEAANEWLHPPAAAQRAPEHPKRPRQQRQQGHDDRRERDEKRRQQRKPGPGPDVGVERRDGRHHQERGKQGGAVREKYGALQLIQLNCSVSYSNREP